MYEKIVEQLKNYCSCIKESDLEADKLEKNVGELIDLISTITCWKNHPCETFLSSQREEVFDVGEFKKCGCDSGIVRIPLFYPMIDPTTIEVSVITRERITFTTHKLEVDKDFSYNPYDSIVYVDLSNIDYKDVSNCGCDELSVRQHPHHDRRGCQAGGGAFLCRPAAVPAAVPPHFCRHLR